MYFKDINVLKTTIINSVKLIRLYIIIIVSNSED